MKMVVSFSMSYPSAHRLTFRNCYIYCLLLYVVSVGSKSSVLCKPTIIFTHKKVCGVQVSPEVAKDKLACSSRNGRILPAFASQAFVLCGLENLYLAYLLKSWDFENYLTSRKMSSKPCNPSFFCVSKGVNWNNSTLSLSVIKVVDDCLTPWYWGAINGALWINTFWKAV